MQETVAFEHVDRVLAELTYPIMRTDAAAELHEVTVEFEAGEDDLGRLVSETDSDAFDSVDDVVADLRAVLED